MIWQPECTIFHPDSPMLMSIWKEGILLRFKDLFQEKAESTTFKGQKAN
jgi:hypothetical protein